MLTVKYTQNKKSKIIFFCVFRYGAPNYAKGGNDTCIAAVAIALGECGHPAQSPWKSITDPVCNFAASGAGGVWQVFIIIHTVSINFNGVC